MAGPSQFGPGGPGQFGPGGQPCPPIHGSQPPPVVQSVKGESTDTARWEVSLDTLYLLPCQVRVTVGHSGLCWVGLWCFSSTNYPPCLLALHKHSGPLSVCLLYNNNNDRLFKAPHLVRAQSTYKDIRIHLHLHIQTHATHSHTRHTHHMHYWWWIGIDQYAEEKRWDFSFDLREWRWMPERERG